MFRRIDDGRIVRLYDEVTRNLFLAMARSSWMHGKTLVRVLCVLAIAVTSVAHVAGDVVSAQAGPLSISASSDTAPLPDGNGVAERCHACAVVSFTAAVEANRSDALHAAIPDGRTLHLFALRLPTTAPPPRPLT